MKIAISSTGNTLESEVSEVFARCPYFLIVETEGKSYHLAEAVKNEYINAGSAGIRAAELIAEKGANGVIAGDFGPRAVDVLSQFNIKAWRKKGAVKEALEEVLSKPAEEEGTE
ncbi:MAG: NifB/NifX family molybdenum-iron cluster-binding protein [Candidatus Aenigmarchaeota archaeon]|nr:NifB/NifX family molybdenum-iron cluster-binding protein [Candidatus Aenigmarchaeota archaeon]